jgi:hypothetical protein
LLVSKKLRKREDARQTTSVLFGKQLRCSLLSIYKTDGAEHFHASIPCFLDGFAGRSPSRTNIVNHDDLEAFGLRQSLNVLFHAVLLGFFPHNEGIDMGTSRIDTLSGGRERNRVGPNRLAPYCLRTPTTLFDLSEESPPDQRHRFWKAGSALRVYVYVAFGSRGQLKLPASLYGPASEQIPQPATFFIFFRLHSDKDSILGTRRSAAQPKKARIRTWRIDYHHTTGRASMKMNPTY